MDAIWSAHKGMLNRETQFNKGKLNMDMLHRRLYAHTKFINGATSFWGGNIDTSRCNGMDVLN